MQISFHGAADTVTGSRHLVQIGGQRILLDCGMFQGFKALHARTQLAAAAARVGGSRRRGAEPRAPGPQRLAAGAGQHGFRGPIHASPATRDLAEVLLLDSAHLQERRRAPRQPLRLFAARQGAAGCTRGRDVQRTLARFQPLAPGRGFSSLGKLRIALTPVGHLLGACACACSRATSAWSFWRRGPAGRPADAGAAAAARGRRVLLIESTLRQPRAPAGGRAAHAWRRSSATPWGAAARCRCGPSPWAARRPAAGCCSG